MKGGDILYEENQLVEMVWTNPTKRIYEPKGYKFTSMYDKFYVMAKELSDSSHAMIKVICDYCGAEVEKPFSNVIKGRRLIQKDACSFCKSKKEQDISRAKRMVSSYNSVRSICEENGYIFIEPDCEYINQHMYIEFICPKHGKQTMILCNFLKQKRCPKCAVEERNKNKLDINFVIKEIEKDGNALLNPGEYKRTTTRNLKIKCICGNEYTTSFDCYVHIGVNRCPVCSKRISKGELIISYILDELKVNYEREKRFYDCRDKNPLPFDFYIPEHNLLIEFDGEQHYKPIRGNVEKFEITKYHDQIKNEYCESHNIGLLRIPYWEKGNIESIIRNKLNKYR